MGERGRDAHGKDEMCSGHNSLFLAQRDFKQAKDRARKGLGVV